MQEGMAKIAIVFYSRGQRVVLRRDIQGNIATSVTVYESSFTMFFLVRKEWFSEGTFEGISYVATSVTVYESSFTMFFWCVDPDTRHETLLTPP